MAPDSEKAGRERSRETPDVDVRKTLLFVFVFLAFALALFAALRIYYRVVTRNDRVETLQAFPAPRLQPNPAQDYVDFHAAQMKQLAGYAWVDRSTALVHLPIERAMALIAARGPRAYDPLEGSPPPETPAPIADARAKLPPGAAPYGEVR